jgi:ATP-dependent DNA ligase
MLAEKGNTSFLDRPDYLYEEKLDGCRCIAFVNPILKETRLVSRSGQDITQKFPELAQLHTQVSKPAILDGEIIGVDFNAVQHRISQQKALAIRVAALQYPVRFHVFDIIDCDYNSIATMPLIERKAVLQRTFAESYSGRVVPWETGSGKELLARTVEQQLEGIMAKQIYSTYVHRRSAAWLKIKNYKEAEFYICGFTIGENERAETFGSIIVGRKVDGKLTYCGKVGSGFTREQLVMMLNLADMMQLDGDCPFEAKVPADIDREIKAWLRPELRAEVRYLELSPNGLLRFPTFRKLMK